MESRRQTCCICGAPFDTPDALQVRCPSCQSARTENANPDGADPKATGRQIPQEESARGDAKPEAASSHLNGSHVASAETADAMAVHGTIVPPTFDSEAADRMVATIDAVRPVEVPRRKEFGRFKVLAVLGQGAFGTVYRAFDPLLDREVALKVPRFSRDDFVMMERFHREAKSAARLHHPNIVALYEHGQTEDGPYLVSEFVDGETLFHVIRRHKFDTRTAVDWVRQISDALHYAHTEGIVHRDIKPGNIMVNKARRPQVMDFGLAKRDVDEDSNVTREGQVLGTPCYMSPEQARGTVAAIGPHSDQYSVGVILYEMLCGCTPFSGQPLVVMSRVGNWADMPPTPRSIRPEIPRDLEACCLKAIEKDPKLRYPSLQALAQDLDSWLKGLPLKARPIGPVEQLGRWCRSNRLIASLSGTLAAIVLVLAIAGPWLAFRFKTLAAQAAADADAANKARLLEKAARLETERILIDNYAEAGLTAASRGDPRQAILLFANAVAAAKSDPERERHNRIRIQSWLNQVAVPILAIPHATEQNKVLAYHPDSQALLSVASSGQASWIDLGSGKEHSIPLPHPITAAAWSPDGKRLAAASNRTVAFFEHPAGSELGRWDNPDAVNCLQFSPDGDLLLMGGRTTVCVLDVASQSLLVEAIEVGSRVIAMDISPDGQRFAVRTDDRRTLAFSITGKSLLPPQPAESEGENRPIFLANDRLLLFDSKEKAIRCWDLDAQQVLWQQAANRVLCMAVSADRQWLALGDNSELLLLDLSAREPVKKKIAHPNLLHGVAFHPQGNLLLTTSNDQSVRVYHVSTSQPACAPIPHNVAAHRCLWSPDGKTFATVNWRGHMIRVWKPQQVDSAEITAPDSATGPFVRFNVEGDRWLSSGFDGRRDRRVLEVVDSQTGQSVGTPLTGPGLISDADFVPPAVNLPSFGMPGQNYDPGEHLRHEALRRSTLLVMVGGNSPDESRTTFKDQSPNTAGFVRFVDYETEKPVFGDVVTPTQPIAVRTSPDGKTVVALCHRSQILLIDVAAGTVRAHITALDGLEADHGYVIRDRIRISPFCDQFAVWGSGSVAEIRDLKTGQLRHSLRHDRDFVHDVQFSPDVSMIATCSSDHSVRLWNAGTGQGLGMPLDHPGWIFSAQFTRDGRRLLTACDDRHARVWDVTTGASVLATHRQPDQVFGVCLLPGEEFFLVCDRSGQLTAWDTRYGKMVAPARQLKGMVYQLSLNSSGDQVVASGRIHPNRMIKWKDWIIERELPFSREEMLLLGEIISAQSVREGAVTSLTPAEWLQRWRRFHAVHSLRDIVERDR